MKGALPQFARALARELAEQHIRVNCVSPGVIRTPFQNFLTPEQASNNVNNRIPLHKEGSPEEVSQLILALVENEFVTAKTSRSTGVCRCEWFSSIISPLLTP